MLAQRPLRDAPIVVGIGIARPQADRLVVIGNGGLVLAQALLRDAPIVVGIGIARPQADRLVVSKMSLLLCVICLVFLSTSLLQKIANGEPSPSG